MSLKVEPESLKLRAADQKVDYNFARALHKICYEEVVTKQFACWDESLQAGFFEAQWKSSTSNIIEYKERPIGLIDFRLAGDHYFLAELQILPEFHRLGIATYLITECMKQAEAEGRSIRLQVLLQNEARELYLRLGFAIIDAGDAHLTMEWFGEALS